MTLKRHTWWLFVTVFLFIGCIFHLQFGSSATGLIDAIFDSQSRFIVLHVRVPRLVMALLSGAAISISGLLMQTLFRNPIAGPYVLGVSSGAGFGVALSILGGSICASLGFTQLSQFFSFPITETLSAILGALTLLVCISIIATRLRDGASLLIIGLMIGMAVSALVSILQLYGSEGEVRRFVLWGMGSLAGVTLHDFYFLIPIITISFAAAYWNRKRLDILLLGEEDAQSIGLHIRNSRFLIILIAGILAGTVTAYAGPIGFIGIAVPHICRVTLKTSSHSILIPASILLGCAFLVICDLIAKMPGLGITLPLNAITALVGAPIVIRYLMRSQKWFL